MWKVKVVGKKLRSNIFILFLFFHFSSFVVLDAAALDVACKIWCDHVVRFLIE